MAQIRLEASVHKKDRHETCIKILNDFTMAYSCGNSQDNTLGKESILYYIH